MRGDEYHAMSVVRLAHLKQERSKDALVIEAVGSIGEVNDGGTRGVVEDP